MASAGFYVGVQAWHNQDIPKQRPGYYLENPPDDWEDCGQCDCQHPPGFTGDCRDDINRWPSIRAIAALEGAQQC